MKRNQLYAKSSRGFTLVEILVVITIIAILSGLGFAGVQSALKKAKRVTALNTITQITTAVDNYFDEYNVLPVDGGSDQTETTDMGNIIAVLTGTEGTGADVKNPKNLKYFTTNEAKADRNGIVYSGDTADQLFDPWGQPYSLIFDSNYDEEIEAFGKTIRSRRVIAWSNGPDEEESEGSQTAGVNRDNIYTF